MGSVVDLALPGVQLPALLVVDSNIVIPRFLSSLHVPHPQAASRASQLFATLQHSGTIGLLTATIAQEIFHFAIAAKYKIEVPNQRSSLVAHFGPRRSYDWKDLYKIDKTILQQFATDLESLRQLLNASNLRFLQPDDLLPIASGRSLDDELVHLIGRYGLDSNDASILMEAQRAGVSSIATLDQDMQRAVADFDVYTWL